MTTVSSMNKAATLLCSGDFKAAREELEELLNLAESKIVTTDTDAEAMVPAYLINLLVYFFLRTSKYFIVNLRMLTCSLYRELQDGSPLNPRTEVPPGH